MSAPGLCFSSLCLDGPCLDGLRLRAAASQPPRPDVR